MSELFDRIARNAEAAMQSEMDSLRVVVQKRIGVPVQRLPGGRVIRSKRGEPPRRDTGRLQASALAQAIDATRVVQGSVSVNTPYAKHLIANDRPIFGSVLQDAKPSILAALRRAITSTKKD